MSLTTLQAIDAEIRQLEAQKKLVAKRDAELPKALEVLRQFASVLTPAQRRQVAKIMAAAADEAPAKVARAAKEGRKLGKVAPRYQLPSGETWSGRGLTPKVFVAWEKSAEGKAWRQANAGVRFPAADGAAVPAASAKAPVKGRRKGVGKRAAPKPLKKAAKKATRRGAG